MYAIAPICRDVLATKHLHELLRRFLFLPTVTIYFPSRRACHFCKWHNKAPNINTRKACLHVLFRARNTTEWSPPLLYRAGAILASNSFYASMALATSLAAQTRIPTFSRYIVCLIAMETINSITTNLASEHMSHRQTARCLGLDVLTDSSTGTPKRKTARSVLHLIYMLWLVIE